MDDTTSLYTFRSDSKEKTGSSDHDEGTFGTYNAEDSTPQPTLLGYWIGSKKAATSTSHQPPQVADRGTAMSFEIAKKLTKELQKAEWLSEALQAAKKELQKQIDEKNARYEILCEQAELIRDWKDRAETTRKHMLSVIWKARLKKFESVRDAIKDEVDALKADRIVVPCVKPLFENRSHSDSVAFEIIAHGLLKPHFDAQPTRNMGLGLKYKEGHYLMSSRGRTLDK